MATICVSWPSLREKRAQRTIDQPRGENFALRRAPFALEKSAGNFSGGICVFTVVHGEGKKILFGGFVVHASRGQHHRIAIARHDGAMRLPGHFAGFERQRASADFQTYLFKHHFTSFCPGSPGTSVQIREILSGNSYEEKSRRERERGNYRANEPAQHAPCWPACRLTTLVCAVERIAAGEAAQGIRATCAN